MIILKSDGSRVSWNYVSLFQTQNVICNANGQSCRVVYWDFTHSYIITYLPTDQHDSRWPQRLWGRCSAAEQSSWMGNRRRERTVVKAFFRVPTAVQEVGKHAYVDYPSGRMLIKQIQLLWRELFIITIIHRFRLLY